MKVLLLHPRDSFPIGSPGTWDLIVDLGCAPDSTYAGWSRQAGCRVFSLYSLAEEIEDLHRVKNLLELGMGQVVDRFGIDWWDVPSLLLTEDLLRFLLAGRLARELGQGSDLYVSRPAPIAEVLRRQTGGTLCNLENRWQRLPRRARHYAQAFAKLDSAQLTQVLKDKFDPEHKIRRRLAASGGKSKNPVTLLPSSYISVTRTAVSFAAMLPQQQFLLVYARNAGQDIDTPPNMHTLSLDRYFITGDQGELSSLLQRLETLRARLISSADEFANADLAGTLSRVPALLRSGVAARNAWNQVFEQENITGCLCADDTVPYTRIPLILARNRGLPSVGCHHGALDYRMAFKRPHADFYLAKGELELDYLVRVCKVNPGILVRGGPASASPETLPHASTGNSLVFFSEPYQTDPWRSHEIYRDLLPRLYSLAKTCSLDLVLKMHPFESIKSFRRLVRKYLPEGDSREIKLVAGPITAELWQSAKFAMTVQSTVALECRSRGIPVFLCGWLREPFGGYIEQFARFGAGHILACADQIAEIPRLLESQNIAVSSRTVLWDTIDPQTLRQLLSGTYRSSAETSS
jgi:hypothetical protein